MKRAINTILGRKRIGWEPVELSSAEKSKDHFILTFEKPVRVHDGRPFAGFSIASDNRHFIPALAEFVIKGYDGPVLECDKCSAEMQLRSGRFGKYFACTSDDCKNTRKLLRSGEPAPPKADPIPMPDLLCEKCEDHYLLRDGAAGIFLAASQFPKNRETRAPTVEEVASVASQLDPKLAYLAEAPQVDSKGRKAVIRFLRKTREQYVMTEVKDKPSGWRAFYRDGKWVEEETKAAPKKKAAKRKKKAAKRKKKAAKRKKSASTQKSAVSSTAKKGRSAPATAASTKKVADG